MTQAELIQRLERIMHNLTELDTKFMDDNDIVNYQKALSNTEILRDEILMGENAELKRCIAELGGPKYFEEWLRQETARSYNQHHPLSSKP